MKKLLVGLMLLSLVIPVGVQAADTKTSALTEDTSPDAADGVYLVDDIEGTPVAKYSTLDNMRAFYLIGNLTGDASGNAGTATALAANGGNCAAGSYPLGVDASGATEDCTDATTEIDSAILTHKGIASDHHTAPTSATFAENGSDELLGEALGTACAENEILKANATGGLDCAADATAGSPTFDQIGNGTNTTATMTLGAGSAFILEDANGAAPTTDGQIKFDRTTERLEVGDGAATNEFYAGAHTTDTFVTNKDTHDHSGGDGAQIDHTGLSNIGTDSHATLDAHLDDVTGDPHAIASDTLTLTNKTIDADGTGNSITNIENADIKVGAAISVSKTALVDGRSLTLTTDTLAADEETYVFTAKIAFEDPTNADDFFFHEMARAATITSIYCKTLVGTVDLDVTVAGADINGTDITCNTTGVLDSSLAGDTSAANGDELALAITSVASAPTYLFVQVNGTFDD